ncbi:MAG: hypothetical protein V1900_01920 [Candidatus Aenigmatarchaeota archaeon]
MKKRSKYVLYLIFSLFVGFLLGVLAIPFFHESGHYLTAYVFNSSAIDKFDYSPVRALKNIIIPPENEIGQQVTFKGDLFEIFPEYQVIIIAFAGIIFELILFALILFLLKKINEKYSRKRDNKFLVGFSFILGFYACFAIIILSWLHDITGIMSYYSIEPIAQIFIAFSLAISIFLVWFFNLIKYWRILDAHAKALDK